MKKIISILLTVVLITSGLVSGLVYAQEPINEVYVNFGTNYHYHVSGNDFVNGEITGERSWGSNLDRKAATSPVTDVILTLDSPRTFGWIDPDPFSMGPPIEWHFGDVPTESGVWAHVGPGNPASFTPGFDASRLVDKINFTAPDTQNLTINVTPKQVLPNLSIEVKVGEDENVIPLITSPTTDPAQGIWLQEDGLGLEIRIENPIVETTYTYDVTIDLTPKIPEVVFIPYVGIAWDENITSGNASGSLLPYTVTGLGTWTWSTSGSYDWQWWENLRRHVHFEGYSRPNEVYINFGTNYHYNPSGDDFFNGEVMGDKNWDSNLDRKGIMSPVTDVRLTLESLLTFDWYYPEPFSMGPPIEWRFGDIPSESGAGVNVGPGGPASFTPGFDASRLVDKINFTAPDTQNLTVTVTPKQAMESLSIDVEVWEDENVIATITSPTTNEALGIWLWEGQKLHIEIQNPVPETTYSYDVTIEVTPKLPEVIFMSQVHIGSGDNITSGTASGSSLSHAVTEVGTWTWSASGDYTWKWWEDLRRHVHFDGYSKEIVEPILHVPMVGQKLVGQGIVGSMPSDGDSTTGFSTTFVFTNPDCVREITIERISIFRADGTVVYEGPLLGGVPQTLKAHETGRIDLIMYTSPEDPANFYTVEIFWNEVKKGCPLIGWIYVVTVTQDSPGNMEIDTLSQTQMVNMEQTLEPEKEGKPK